MRRRHVGNLLPSFSSGRIAIPLTGPLLALMLLALSSAAQTQPPDGHAILPLRDSSVVETEETAGSILGRTVASELTALFIKHLPDTSLIRIVDQEMITKTLDEAGMEMLGLVTHAQAADIGDILSADYVWYGSYTFIGDEISVRIALWSMHTGSAVSGTSIRISDYSFVEDPAHMQAMACSLFEKMYEAVTGEAIEVDCIEASSTSIDWPIVVVQVPFPMGELLVVPFANVATAKLSAVNNVIDRANGTAGINMGSMRWALSGGLRAGYSFAGGLEAIATATFLHANAHAGASAATSMTVTSSAVMGGVAYHLRVSELEVILEALGGWQGALLDVTDHSNVLDCPDHVAGHGIGFEFSASAMFSVLPGVNLQARLGYRGADLATASTRLPRIDLTGITLGVGLGITFGGSGT
jgi:hypothetical protein